MSRECYIERAFSVASEVMIAQANQIIAEYDEIGLTLTLRQLYYQFVSRDLIPNNHQSYKRLGALINNARLAGRIDWEAIEDRTRNLAAMPHWKRPADIINDSARDYLFDLWEDQPVRLEVWIEKDALTGVIERTCRQFDVPFFSCRGYTSQSEQWRAAERFHQYIDNGQKVVVLHLGDHDPSGLDMTRDNEERLVDTFLVNRDDFEVCRLALNIDQVRRYKPPPNYAKDTDSRFSDYARRYGESSWELDALDPRVLQELVESAIVERMDTDKFKASLDRLKEERAQIAALAASFDPKPPKKRKRS